jgi:hypothetical protein
LDLFCKGFWSIVPLEWIDYFTADELEAQLCGSSVIDVEDWYAHTELIGFNTIFADSTLNNFWTLMRAYE